MFLMNSIEMNLFVIFFLIMFLNNKIYILGLMIKNILVYFVNTLLSSKFLLSKFWYLIIFFILVAFNLMSLFSYVYPLSLKLLWVFLFSLMGWGISQVIKVLWNNWSMINLIPSNVPIFLLFIMMVIEIVSTLIQPLTLSIRLGANILSGHVLLMLMSELKILLFIFLTMEIGVSIIQGLVYFMLMMLYN